MLILILNIILEAIITIVLSMTLIRAFIQKDVSKDEMGVVTILIIIDLMCIFMVILNLILIYGQI